VTQASHPAAAGLGQNQGSPVLAFAQSAPPQFHQNRGNLGLVAASVVQVMIVWSVVVMALVPG
jgi:hypothetical protein